MSLYRYKIVTDEFTTYRINPPTTDGQIDPTFFEHGTLDDGFTYCACGVPLPAEQWPQCEVAEVFPPQQYKQALREISPHQELLDKRVAAGLLMQADLKIVKGNATQVANWKAQQDALFGIS